MDTGSLKEELSAARNEARVARIYPGDLPDDQPAAYALAFSLIAPFEVGAWKIGGANPWSQAAFGNTEPFFGALAHSELFIETESVSLAGLVSPLAEPEIMLELGSLPDDDGNATFSRMGLGVEIPASVLPTETKGQLVGQIIDRAGAGLVWVGDVRPYDPTDIDSLKVLYGKAGDTLVEGGSQNVIGGPLGATRAFLKRAKSLGAPIAVGQWIATAGLVKAVPVAAGDEVVISTSDSRLSVKFM